MELPTLELAPRRKSPWFIGIVATCSAIAIGVGLWCYYSNQRPKTEREVFYEKVRAIEDGMTMDDVDRIFAGAGYGDGTVYYDEMDADWYNVPLNRHSSAHKEYYLYPPTRDDPEKCLGITIFFDYDGKVVDKRFYVGCNS